MSCDGLPDAYLDARLQGAIETELSWGAADMRCEGMERPLGRGLRVAFSGAAGGERLTLLFAAPTLAEGAAGRAVPVNVTLIREGGALYGTRGEDKCLFDEVRQDPLPATNPGNGSRRWRIEARGFCLDPARAIGGGVDAILLARFDFRGQLEWQPYPPPPAPATAPSPGP